MFLEVESSENFEGSLFLRFKEVGPAQPISQVRLYDRTSKGEWCDVVGWSDDNRHPVCPAFGQPVEDSGAGFAYLVFGGNCGVRLKPITVTEEWSVESSHQWGESHLLLADVSDLRFVE